MRGRRQAYPNLGHGSNRLEGTVETARRRVLRAVEPGRPSITCRPFPPAPLSGPVRFRPSLNHLSTRALRTCFRLAHPLWVDGAPVSAWRSCSDGCGLREGVRRRRRVNGRPRRRASVSARGGAVRPLCLGAPVSAWRTRCELAAHPFPRGAPVPMGADCG